MRIKTIEHEGIEIHSYNDSGVEWVVYCDEMSEQRFDMNNWTQKDAMEFYCRIYDQFTDHA